jgi:NAD(P)H-quinone oxidoreductase subunit 5
VIEYVRDTGEQKLDTPPSLLALLTNLALSLGVFLGIAAALGIDVTKRPGETAVITIFKIAVAYLLVKGNTGRATPIIIGRTILMAALVTLAFFTLELLGIALLGSAVAVYPTPDLATLIAMALTVITFGIVTVLSAWLPALAQRPQWQAFYVHLKNGFYVNTLFDRFIQSTRVAR